MKFFIIFTVLLAFNSQAVFAFHASARLPGKIIYNSTTGSEQKIALGVNPEGHLNTSREEDGGPNIAKNASYTGVAYKFPIGSPRANGDWSGPDPITTSKWYDAIAPGCQCEGWGAGGIDSYGRQFYGYANASSGIVNVKVVNFTYDLSSIESVTTVNDSAGDPALQIRHVYGPSPLATDKLFEAVVTITNISGQSITDVRYNRSMDWDIPDSEFSERVTIGGVTASAGSATKPRVKYSGNNGFMNGNPFNSSSSHTKWPKSGVVNTDYERAGPADHGATFTFEFGDLSCGENHNFITYYGAAENKETMKAALSLEGAAVYSIGEANGTYGISDVAFGFGFKGVSGTALAPTLPIKTAIIPSGELTDETKIQTYASPVIANNAAYQAVFTYRNNHQWQGDILKYSLESDGSFVDSAPKSAKTKLAARGVGLGGKSELYTSFQNNTPAALATGMGRNIWTVGYDPNCPGDGTPFRRSTSTITTTRGLVAGLSVNNFLPSSAAGGTNNLDELFYNCAGEVSSGDTLNLIDFVRGWDAYGEDPGSIRQSFFADTFHADVVYVGSPSAATSASGTYTEAYFRGKNGYTAFKDTWKDREGRLYVGSNDGMLHAFDSDLNHLWGFIPPSILPKLRKMEGLSGQSVTQWLVDGPIIVKDIFIKASSEWKTLLIGGLGWGGKGYYVLDITDPDVPKHLFTFDNDYKNKQVSYWSESGYKQTYNYAAAPDNMNYSKIGDTWARPTIMLMPIKDASDSTFNQRYTMVFGAGYAGGTTTDIGSYVYVLDFEPSEATFSDPVLGTTVPKFNGGNVIKIVTVTPDASSDIPNGVTAHMSVVTPDRAAVPVGKEALAYYGGIAYFPDLQGQVWKLDLSKTALIEDDSSMYTLSLMFKTEGSVVNDRYGYNQMAATMVESSDISVGTYLFQYFGTGDQAHIQRRSASISNRIYGLKDLDWPGTDLTLTGTNKNIASAGMVNIDTEVCSLTDVPGWHSGIQSKTTLSDAPIGDGTDNQRVIGRAIVANKDVYFTVYRPEDKSCPAYGSGETIKLANGCGGAVTTIAIGAGLTTSPVLDIKGNIYVGVSNLATGKTLEGKGEDSAALIGVSSLDNILKIGSSTVAAPSSATPGIKIKSWREVSGNY